MKQVSTWCKKNSLIMISWISLFITIVTLSQCECMSCDSTEYPHDDYTKKSCRPHESSGDKPSCEVIPKMYVNDSASGTVVVEFNILSRSCNVSHYAFRFEVDEHLNETNCKSKLFKGSEHSAERVVLIRYDEGVPSCGKTQNVTFEHVYQSCYRLGYIHTIDNKRTQKLKTQYLKTTYIKEETPCAYTYITPINIKLNAVEISMTNFSKFDTIYATVTKPEGDFACDDVTDLERFMWVMTHDSKGTFMCKRNGEKHNEEICCRRFNHNIECTIHNIAPGNYCYYVIMSYVYCNPLSSKRALHQKFTIPEEPALGKAQEISPDNYILLVVVFLCLVVVCFVVLMIIWKRKTRSLFAELYFNEEEYSVTEVPKILLLYPRDCEWFMKMMVTFRDLLEEMTTCKVYDCFDPILGEEVAQSKIDWMRSHVSSDDFKIVVVESSAAVLHQQALFHSTKVGYREPTWLDELFLYGLKALTDDLKRNTYQDIFVMRIDGFTEEKNFLHYLAPHRRYVVPQHLKILLDDLSLKSNLSAVPCFGAINDGNWKKFEQDLENLLNYKRQNPDYLDEVIKSVICKYDQFWIK